MRHLPFLLSAAVREIDKRVGVGERRQLTPREDDDVGYLTHFLGKLCDVTRWYVLLVLTERAVRRQVKSRLVDSGIWLSY